MRSGIGIKLRACLLIMTSELVLEWKIYGKKLVQVQGLFPSKPQSDYNIHEPYAVNPATTNYPISAA